MMPQNPIEIFDKSLLLKQKLRAAKAADKYQFLFKAAADILCEHLDCMHRTYQHALHYYAKSPALSDRLSNRSDIRQLITSTPLPSLDSSNNTSAFVIADEMMPPFANAHFDLLVSTLALHWVNDMPGCLTQARKLLKPNGLFLVNLFGAGTLEELRKSMVEADKVHYNGVAARVIPFVEVKTMGMLLQRTGFDMPITDSETITVKYPNTIALMHDLRYMGEANALIKRSKKPVSRAWLATVDAFYREHFSDGEGGILATFEILTATALAPNA